jgi:hypothetical protein
MQAARRLRVIDVVPRRAESFCVPAFGESKAANPAVGNQS